MQPYEDFAHIGPDTLGGKFLRRFWQPICVSHDLVIGRPKRIEVLSEHFTAYRGEDGRAHVVQDTCPHRQTRLFLGWVEGDCIRCFYHGWKFDPEGNCVEQPAEDEAFKRKIKIRAQPTRDYLGFVFAYLGEGEAPPFPLFPEVDLDRDTVLYNRHPVPCNFFQRIENDLDELHIHFVHRVTTQETDLVELPDIQVSETDYGILRIGKRADEGHNITRTAHIFMPNVLMTITPGRPSRPQWMLHLAWRVPVNDETMASFIISAAKGGGEGLKPRPERGPDAMEYTREILEGRMRVQDIDPDYPSLVPVQDNVALAGQGIVIDRSVERLGQSDRGVILMRKLWERELKAIADGQPLKAWKRPKESLFGEQTKELALAIGG